MSGMDSTVIELPKRRARATLSLAPLIDVTFLLLIFFMLASQFDQFSPVEIPLKNTFSEETRAAPPNIPTVTIILHADGSYRLNGPKIKRPLITEQTRDHLVQAFADAGQTATTGKKSLILEADPDVPLQHLMDALAFLNKFPDTNVNIRLPRNLIDGTK